MKDDKLIYEIFIRTTPETLWRALIGPDGREKVIPCMPLEFRGPLFFVNLLRCWLSFEMGA